MPQPEYDIIAHALAEDIGPGDVTAYFFTNPARTSEAVIIAKEPLVVAGTAVASEVFRRVDPKLSVEVVAQDGARLNPRDVALKISGPTASLVTAERTALNFLQRLSGIATLARQYVDAVAGTSARILDTRKTTPGLRVMEKAAAAAGGVVNHRMGLYDMVMVKDNHLAAHSSHVFLQKGIERAKALHPGIRVELEADTVDQVREFLTLDGVDVILLDNMTPEQLREAVSLRTKGVVFEASGGITLDNVAEVAATGVDFISIGAITHSARAVDFSLEITG